MRVAVLGVGLIGGSVALAARRLPGVHVTGWDADPRALEQAAAAGVLDEAVGALADAREIDVWVVAVPLVALAATVDRACALARDGAIVTDVGSTKHALVAGAPSDTFIGGHPLAGAETSGVQHARADLFDGATWYLTPGPDTSGVHFDRLRRFVASLGAAPVAIDAAAHDRLMAAVSHLPHVLANVLVQQAASALGGETLPATGPSFRDATRVAGANPPLWAQIYAANAEALGAQMDATIAQLQSVRGQLRRSAGLAAGGSGAPPRPAGGRSCGRPGGGAACRRPQPPGGRRGDRAHARARRHRHLRHVAGPLQRPPNRDRGAVDRVRRRPARPRPHHREGPHRHMTEHATTTVRFDPVRRLKGTLTPPADKSISHRAALLGAMASEPVRVHNFLDAADTNSTLAAMEQLGALVDRQVDHLVIRGTGLREAAPADRHDRRGQRRHAHAPAARLACGPGRPRLHARRRRVHPPPPRRSRRGPAASHGRRRSTRPTSDSRPSPSTANACTASTTRCRSPAPR